MSGYVLVSVRLPLDAKWRGKGRKQGMAVLEGIRVGIDRGDQLVAGGGEEINWDFLRDFSMLARVINARSRRFVSTDTSDQAKDVFENTVVELASCKIVFCEEVFSSLIYKPPVLEDVPARQFTFRVPLTLIDEIDDARKQSGETRSSIIRRYITPSAQLDNQAAAIVRAMVRQYQSALVRLRGNLTSLAPIDKDAAGFLRLRADADKASKEVRGWMNGL